MKERHLLKLTIAHIYVILLYVLLAFFPVTALSRALLLFTGFIAVTIIFNKSSLYIQARKTNKKFFLLTLLWNLMLGLFIINEGLNRFGWEAPLILEWIDTFLLLILSLITALSFLFKNPFWYAQVKSKYIPLIGGVLLTIFSWLSFQITRAFVDYLGKP